MNIVNKVKGVVITLVISVLVFFLGVKAKAESTPLNLYQVYLNGEKIGLIENKEKLLNLIDQEQAHIKKQYNVDKVYPPNGLDIQSITTYDNNISDEKTLYEEIKDKEPFTISGYKVTIKYPEEQNLSEGEEDTGPKETVVMNVLDKEDFETGFYNTMAAFIGSSDLDKFKNNVEVEIQDVGEKLEDVSWYEDITIKKDYLSTKEYIYTNSSDISRYLLFGTLEDNESYTVKDGDSVSSIAESNRLNVDEFLIANPEFKSANTLLAEGQVVNTTLIDPVVSIAYKKTKIEDVEVPFQTVYEDDPSMYVGTNVTVTEGKNGTKRLTEDILYVNGEIRDLKVTNDPDIVPTINKVVKRGTKVYSNYQVVVPQNNDGWVWPALPNNVITSRYSWRWGRMHEGIDLSGAGYGSPVFAAGSGTVVQTGSNSANGTFVTIDHGNDYYTIYMHLYKYSVSVGQSVTAGQQIGQMGNSGRSFGTHLHIGVFIGFPYRGGKSVDPCRSIFSC